MKKTILMVLIVLSISCQDKNFGNSQNNPAPSEVSPRVSGAECVKSDGEFKSERGDNFFYRALVEKFYDEDNNLKKKNKQKITEAVRRIMTDRGLELLLPGDTVQFDVVKDVIKLDSGKDIIVQDGVASSVQQGTIRGVPAQFFYETGYDKPRRIYLVNKSTKMIFEVVQNLKGAVSSSNVTLCGPEPVLAEVQPARLSDPQNDIPMANNYFIYKLPTSGYKIAEDPVEVSVDVDVLRLNLTYNKRTKEFRDESYVSFIETYPGNSAIDNENIDAVK